MCKEKYCTQSYYFQNKVCFFLNTHNSLSWPNHNVDCFDQNNSASSRSCKTQAQTNLWAWPWVGRRPCWGSRKPFPTLGMPWGIWFGYSFDILKFTFRLPNIYPGLRSCMLNIMEFELENLFKKIIFSRKIQIFRERRKICRLWENSQFSPLGHESISSPYLRNS